LFAFIDLLTFHASFFFQLNEVCIFWIHVLVDGNIKLGTKQDTNMVFEVFILCHSR